MYLFFQGKNNKSRVSWIITSDFEQTSKNRLNRTAKWDEKHSHFLQFFVLELQLNFSFFVPGGDVYFMYLYILVMLTLNFNYWILIAKMYKDKSRRSFCFIFSLHFRSVFLFLFVLSLFSVEELFEVLKVFEVQRLGQFLTHHPLLLYTIRCVCMPAFVVLILYRLSH